MTDGEGPWKSPSFKRWAEEEEENRRPWGQVTPERSEEEEGMDGGEDGRAHTCYTSRPGTRGPLCPGGQGLGVNANSWRQETPGRKRKERDPGASQEEEELKGYCRSESRPVGPLRKSREGWGRRVEMDEQGSDPGSLCPCIPSFQPHQHLYSSKGCSLSAFLPEQRRG